MPIPWLKSVWPVYKKYRQTCPLRASIVSLRIESGSDDSYVESRPYNGVTLTSYFWIFLIRIQHKNSFYLEYRLQRLPGAATLCHYRWYIGDGDWYIFRLWFCRSKSSYLTRPCYTLFKSCLKRRPVLIIEVEPTLDEKQADGYRIFMIFNIV